MFGIGIAINMMNGGSNGEPSSSSENAVAQATAESPEPEVAVPARPMPSPAPPQPSPSPLRPLRPSLSPAHLTSRVINTHPAHVSLIQHRLFGPDPVRVLGECSGPVLELARAMLRDKVIVGAVLANREVMGIIEEAQRSGVVARGAGVPLLDQVLPQNRFEVVADDDSSHRAADPAAASPDPNGAPAEAPSSFLDALLEKIVGITGWVAGLVSVVTRSLVTASAAAGRPGASSKSQAMTVERLEALKRELDARSKSSSRASRTARRKPITTEEALAMAIGASTIMAVALLLMDMASAKEIFSNPSEAQ